jgi:hypothetical protein
VLARAVTRPGRRAGSLIPAGDGPKSLRCYDDFPRQLRQEGRCSHAPTEPASDF